MQIEGIVDDDGSDVGADADNHYVVILHRFCILLLLLAV